MIRKGYRYLLTAVIAASAAALLTFAARNDFGLGRNMEITVNMMRELSLGYVDPVDPDKLMEGAAEGMVSDLDPYTEFIPEDQMSNFELLTTGKYGGVGSLIRKKGDWVTIAQPYKGSPADRAGLKIGDKILAIDGKDAKGFTTEQVSSRLKGDPGSKVRVTVEHLTGGTETVTLQRERIAIPGVPYAGWVGEGIGYIRHSDFTEGCYEDMRAAIERLRSEGELKGLILDYRSNGGGIMQEAVKILGMFVLTTAKYYIPSGRCIQAIDYSHSQEGTVRSVPDSLISEYTTRAGRKVYDGGGIMPDIRTEPEYISRFAMTLYALGFIEDFGDEYVRRHPGQQIDIRTFSITDGDYAEFAEFMKDKEVPYESDTRRALKKLREAAKTDRFEEVEQQIAAIDSTLRDDTATNLETYRKEIVESINNDIVLRHGYSEGVIEHSLPDDGDVLKAIEILGNGQEYARIVTEQDTPRK